MYVHALCGIHIRLCAQNKTSYEKHALTAGQVHFVHYIMYGYHAMRRAVSAVLDTDLCKCEKPYLRYTRTSI